MENKEKMNTPNLNLSGQELPKNWPEIMSFVDQEKALEDAGAYEDWSPVEPFSISLENARTGKRLEYLAITHTQTPEHEQFDQIEERFNTTNPDIVLYEGPENSRLKFTGDVSREEVIRKGGEVGFVQWLAYKNEIPMKSLDIQFDDWVEGFRQQGYSNEEIATFEIARDFFATAEHVREDKDKEGKSKYDLDKLDNELMFEEFKQRLDNLPRSDGQEWTYDLINEEYKKITKTDFDLTLANNNATSGEKNYVNAMRKMFTDEDKFREKYMIDQITSALKTHDKVFAEAGSSHPIRQRKALEEFMG